MAVIYLSSTYDDLKDHRKTVYSRSRQLNHDVRAMEDFVAIDQRPITLDGSFAPEPPPPLVGAPAPRSEAARRAVRALAVAVGRPTSTEFSFRAA